MKQTNLTRFLCRIALAMALTIALPSLLMAGDRFNFNADWRLALGSEIKGNLPKLNDKAWLRCTLPYAWNQSEAYSRNCSELSDTTMWYRKHFVAPKEWKGKRIFIEFEGARFGAQVFINGHELGWADNGVMAFGFDLTPYIIYGKDNVVSVFVDNDWRYHEKSSGSTFQWNDKNFYCNYGGINKNVWLHVMPEVYQTLPLYSNLGTVGTYVYASDINVKGKSATINVETQVVNSSKKRQEVTHRVAVIDKDGREVASFTGEKRMVMPGDTVTLTSRKQVGDLHLWSWGYGYLYTVKSTIAFTSPEGGDRKGTDTQSIETGFRKTAFADGMLTLNDRVLHMKGFAQRSTNEWPALGISIPAWVSDYSNRQILECNGNFVRWMHVTPSKQDIRSFDRLGLIQAMPAGDAEKDVTDRRWQQRCEVMRNAIIYNRNNPSILFYEGGNNQISEAHMAELKAIRDLYDPHGGRAIGSRNMLDSKVAEYGGEMLYVNKSATKPMWQMEYNRDEGVRMHWDRWSYPYHNEGDGPLYRGDRAVAYNHNQDGLAVENIVRWNEYWMARPGTGRRVNAGGAKIIFADSNTHARGEKNYRTSGVMDAMRIPKDSWYVLQTMWDGWVDTEKDHTYIIGHWNYDNAANAEATHGGVYHKPANEQVAKPVYVCSTGDEVELLLKTSAAQGNSNAGEWKSLGKGKRSNTFLFTFDSIRFEPGTLRAVSYRNGKAVSEYQLETAGKPVALRMHWVDRQGDDNTFRADAADIRIAEIEAIDAQGRRHPLADDMIRFFVDGNCDYLGGLSGVVGDEQREANRIEQETGVSNAKEGHNSDTNSIGSHELKLEAGVIRVMVRSTLDAGNFSLTATPVSGSELAPMTLSGTTIACPVKDGFYVDANGNRMEADWAKLQPMFLSRGETPATPSYSQTYTAVGIKNIEVAVNQKDVKNLTDDNEDSRWSSDTKLENSWLKVTLSEPAAISRIALRMNNFRTTSYPLQIFAGETLIWEGYTEKCLGDNHIFIPTPVTAEEYTIRMIGPATVKEAFASMTELAAKKNVSTEASKSNTLSIIEMEMCKTR